MDKPEIKKVTTADAVYDQLRNDIINLYYQPGEKLSEAKIADRYGVSRDPVRKSISRLVQEGLIISKPQCGTFVSKISADQGKEVCEIRIILETFAIRNAVNVIDEALIDSMLEEYNKLDKRLEFEDGEDLRNSIYALDAKLHNAIYDCCGNSMIASTISSYAHITKRIQIANITYHERKFNTMEEMHEIMLALKARDVERSVEAMRKHIENIKQTVGVAYSKKSEGEAK